MLPAPTTPIAQKDGTPHPAWHNYFQQMTQYISNTVSPEGLAAPPQNTANIATLNTQQSAGNIIYNTDTGLFMANQAGTFKTITTS
ncbi:MAG TPA: hypothetical protein VHZ76_00975 [Gammaproteobacteria bacterium]|nr:hypothetical protein [Gammaproteobacteria bacterium]